MATALDVRHELWRRGEITWKLHSTQAKIDHAIRSRPYDEALIFSSRQLGKSFWATAFAVAFCVANPGKIVRILAPTLKQVSDIVADNLEPIALDAPPGLIKRMKSAYRWKIGQSELRLGALERAHVNGNRGGNAALIILEEGGFVPSDDYEYAVRSVIGPQLLRSGGKLIHVTTPSDDPNHYIHEEVKPRCELSDSFFHYTIYDNPQLSAEAIAKAMRLAGGEKSAAWLREYLAQIVRDIDTVIMPSFERTRHVKEMDLPSYKHWFMSLDSGGVRDLHAAVIGYYDFYRARTVIWDAKYWPQGTTTRVIVEGLKELEMESGLTLWNGKNETTIEKITRVGDASAQALLDISELYGYHMTLPPKDDRDAGIANLDLAFYDNVMEIHPRCKHVILSLEAGRWNPNRTDFVRTKALGHWDSGMALVYGYRVVNKANPYPEQHIGSGQLRVREAEARSGEAQIANLFDRARPKLRMK